MNTGKFYLKYVTQVLDVFEMTWFENLPDNEQPVYMKSICEIFVKNKLFFVFDDQEIWLQHTLRSSVRCGIFQSLR